MNKTTLDWIKDVRKGCKKVLERDAEQVLKILKKGSFDTEKFYPLLMEIKDNERDDALLSLIEGMLEEEASTLD